MLIISGNMNKTTELIESGVYLLFNKGEVVYIGESGSLYSRIGTHRKNKLFDSFRVLSCKQSRRRYWEKVLIKKFLPRYNKKHTPKVSSEELKTSEVSYFDWRTSAERLKCLVEADKIYQTLLKDLKTCPRSQFLQKVDLEFELKDMIWRHGKQFDDHWVLHREVCRELVPKELVYSAR